MAEQHSQHVVQKAYDAFQRGDIPAVLDMLTEDVEWIIPGPEGLKPAAGTRHGRAGAGQFFAELGAQEDVEQFTPTQFITEGDTVVTLVDYRGRVKSSGRTHTNKLAHVFTVRGDRIARFIEYSDTAAALEASRA